MEKATKQYVGIIDDEGMESIAEISDEINKKDAEKISYFTMRAAANRESRNALFYTVRLTQLQKETIDKLFIEKKNFIGARQLLICFKPKLS